MKKYILVMKNAWQRQLVYRGNIFGYRLGNVVDFLFQVGIWTAIYKSTDVIYGYNYSEMMSYILVGWLFSFLTTNYGVEDSIAQHIQNGYLTNFLIKPMKYLSFQLANTIGRASIAMTTGAALQFALIAIFHKFFLLPNNLYIIPLIILIVILGFIVRLLLAMLIGMIAFWTTDISGYQYFLNTIVRFLSGGFAPLSLLPASIYAVCKFFPFAYIIFFPTQLYLGKLTLFEGFVGLLIEMGWIVILYFAVKFTWRKGMIKYEGIGI